MTFFRQVWYNIDEAVYVTGIRDTETTMIFDTHAHYDDESFDEAAFELSGENDLKSWRTDNINKLVSAAYKTVKACNENILFGISPQGNIGNNYEHMYPTYHRN